MLPIISIVGKSNSGKTTLMEQLITELKQRGYRIAVIKHTAEDFAPDTAGKDSWRFSQAGSQIAAVSSANQIATTRLLEHEITLRELPLFIGWDYDIILTEGFKKASAPKIEVHRKEQGSELVSPPEQLLAVVTDEPLTVNVPQFSKDESRQIADLIETKISAQQSKDDTVLFVNGMNIPVNPFVGELLSKTLTAIASTLKGTEDIKSVQVWTRRGHP